MVAFKPPYFIYKPLCPFGYGNYRNTTKMPYNARKCPYSAFAFFNIPLRFVMGNNLQFMNIMLTFVLLLRGRGKTLKYILQDNHMGFC